MEIVRDSWNSSFPDRGPFLWLSPVQPKPTPLDWRQYKDCLASRHPTRKTPNKIKCLNKFVLHPTDSFNVIILGPTPSRPLPVQAEVEREAGCRRRSAEDRADGRGRGRRRGRRELGRAGAPRILRLDGVGVAE